MVVPPFNVEESFRWFCPKACSPCEVAQRENKRNADIDTDDEEEEEEEEEESPRAPRAFTLRRGLGRASFGSSESRRRE